jgi:hypothetical protein
VITAAAITTAAAATSVGHRCNHHDQFGRCNSDNFSVLSNAVVNSVLCNVEVYLGE